MDGSLESERSPVTVSDRNDRALHAVALRRVTVCGLVSWVGYLCLLRLSVGFAYGEPAATRPLLWFVGLMSLLFGLQLVALRVAIRCPDQTAIWKVVVLFAVGFRLLAVFSEPIQELDYYRYLWDGHCVAAGVSPYRYSPAAVQRATANDESSPADLRRLATVRDSDPVVATILNRIHFEDLPTIYPPVSQAVFAAAAVTTTRRAGLATRIVILKVWIVAFDLGVLLLLGALLRHTGVTIGWAVAYGWSPLVIKEFANSGHLDAIAVFFCLLAIYAVVRAVYPDTNAPSRRRRLLPTDWLWISAGGLSLAIGAKLYPVILAPLLGLTVWHHFGGWRAIRISAVTALLALLFCWPLWFGASPAPIAASQSIAAIDSSANEAPVLRSVETASAPPWPMLDSQDHDAATTTTGSESPTAHSTATISTSSLTVFLTQWKMNDLLFLVVESNLNPGEQTTNVEPWFAVTPREWRHRFVKGWSERLHLDAALLPFVIARVSLTGLFLMLAAYWARAGAKSASAQTWLRCAFLTLAWFWLLSPTMNPWYWIWALPLVPFAGRRGWLAVAGFLPLYYLRFWFAYHWPASPVAGTPYEGAAFFDFVVVWLEHGPWLALLLWESRKSPDVCNALQTKTSVSSIIPPDGINRGTENC